MAKISLLTISLFFLSSCSREANIAIPEPLPGSDYQETPNGGDDAITDPGKPIEPIETDIPKPGTEEPTFPTIPEPEETLFAEPHEVVGELASFYNREIGLWPEGWKTSAYATMAMIDYMAKTNTLDFTWMLDTTYRKNMFAKDDFEENAAWGLTWLAAYDLTKELRYLEAAKSLHDTIINTAWDETCGGGLFGRLDKTTKTAVANLLYIRLASSLHQRLPEVEHYRENALKAWDWFSNSPLIGENRRLRNSIAAADCSASSDAVNTQTQGIIIGTLTSLFQMSQDQAYLSEAKAYVSVAFEEFLDSEYRLIEKGTLACEPCMNDEPLFKGIFISNLGLYLKAAKDETITRFLKLNALSAGAASRGTGGMIGYRWDQAFDRQDSSRQTAAALLFNTQILKPLERNYAFNGDTRTSAICTAGEAAAQAFDASASTKWCGGMLSGAINHLSVDLGAQRTVKTVRIMHAGTGGESRSFNTKDFELQISSNGSDFTTLATIRGNLSSMSFHRVSGTGRYLRLRFTSASVDAIGRIYEMSME